MVRGSVLHKHSINAMSVFVAPVLPNLVSHMFKVRGFIQLNAQDHMCVLHRHTNVKAQPCTNLRTLVNKNTSQPYIRVVHATSLPHCIPGL